MELCEGGSLKCYAEKCKSIPEATLWSFFADIMHGLAHIHAAG